MVGILVITHGEMAEGIISGATMIMGQNERFECLSLIPDTDLTLFSREVYRRIVSLDDGNGVIVLVDLFGASPWNFTAMNVGCLLDSGHKVRLITGVNLPMVIEALNDRSTENDIEELYKSVLSAGKEGIREFFEELED